MFRKVAATSAGSAFQSQLSLCSSQNNVNATTETFWRDRHNFRWFLPALIRCKDQNASGDLHDVEYHSLFDTAMDVFLNRHCGMKPDGDYLGYMAKNEIRKFEPAVYAQVYLSGIAIDHIGNSSVKFKTGLFAPQDPSAPKELNFIYGHYSGDRIVDTFRREAVCIGEYVNVFVASSQGNKPIRIPEDLREKFETLRPSGY